MTKYPVALPIDTAMTVIDQIIAGHFDIKYLAKLIWEGVGYTLDQLFGELGEALVNATQSFTDLTAKISQLSAFPKLQKILQIMMIIISALV